MRCAKCGAATKGKAKVCGDKTACADRVLDKAAKWFTAGERALSPGIRRVGESSVMAQRRLYNEAMSE